MSRAQHHVVYRFFATNGDLLYVGKSNGFMNRLQQHQGNAAWFEDVATITVEHHINGTDAALAEEAAIRTERPLYNVKYADAGVILKSRHNRYPESSGHRSLAESIKLDGLVRDEFSEDIAAANREAADSVRGAA